MAVMSTSAFILNVVSDGGTVTYLPLAFPIKFCVQGSLLLLQARQLIFVVFNIDDPGVLGSSLAARRNARRP